MPINPGYKFMNDNANLSDLGGTGFRGGMGLWQGPQPGQVTPPIPDGITPSVMQAVQMGRAQQQQPQQPIAPVAPMAPRQQMQAAQMPMTEQDLPPEFPQPEVEQQSLGYGNIEDIPTNEGLDNTPQSANHNDQQNQELQRFEQTQLAKRGSDMGMDPRQLYVALAQFSAGMGNIKGKDTRSTAGDFYNMQKVYENQDEARKMRQEEFAARMAPKPVDPLNQEYLKSKIAEMNRKGMPAPATELDPARQDLYKSQADWYRAKTRNEQLGSQRPMAPTKDGKPQADMLNPKQIKSATDLRKEYQNHPVTKTSNDLNAMWGKVREVMDNPSAAGDMASIFLFMKALDPGSTVREGEYKSAAEATSALGRVEQSLKKAGTGQNLTPEQRADFRSIMEKFYRAQMKSQKRVDDQYKGLAGRTGVDPQNLLINDSSQPSAIKSVNDLPDVR